MCSAPTEYGRYLLLEPIKSGGMSEIWRARRLDADAVVAIKRLLPQFARQQESMRLFLDEARVAVQLTHPNIARVFDLGRVDGELYLAMEYVGGVDLQSLFLRSNALSRPPPIPLVAFVMAQICDALDYAHRRTDSRGLPMGIVHRDVAPDNCLVTFDGEVKLIDFGVAKASIRTSETKIGALKGKLAYMSPEQVRGKQVDHRSDLFSAGVVLHELVTGRRLFDRDGPAETLHAVYHDPIAPPRKVNPNVPAELDRVIMKALARDPEQRFTWASELASALRCFLVSLPRPPSAAQLAGYLAGAFAAELDQERERRAAWVREVSGVRELKVGDSLEDDTGPSIDAGAPTLLERPSAEAAPRQPSPVLRPKGDNPAARRRPTVDALPRMTVPDQVLPAPAPLPPKLPAPERPSTAIASLVEQAAAGEFVEIDENRQPTVALDLDAPPSADDTTQVPRRKPRR